MDERDTRILELELANHRLTNELKIMEGQYLALKESLGGDFSVSTRAARPPQQTCLYRVKTSH